MGWIKTSVSFGLSAIGAIVLVALQTPPETVTSNSAKWVGFISGHAPNWPHQIDSLLMVPALALALTPLWLWLWKRYRPTPMTALGIVTKPASRPVLYDAELTEGLAYIATGQWGTKVSELDQKDPATERRLEAIKGEFEQAAADGTVQTWGRPVHRPEHTVGFNNVRPIEREMWYDRLLAWDGMLRDYSHAYPTGAKDDFPLIDIRINRQQFTARWPN